MLAQGLGVLKRPGAKLARKMHQKISVAELPPTV
jgi:hypothetical protein